MHLRFPITGLLAFASFGCFAYGQASVGELYSAVARVRGSVNLAGSGTSILSGSSIEAGDQPARLVLSRGGVLNVCQKTSVSVSASASGRDLMFSFGSGSIESRYTIGASSDTIITPDFRFVITGPGEFDLDLSITPQGDTCVQSHRESTGGVIVSEQLGDATYQIKPSDFVVFRKGRIAGAEVSPAEKMCGCPVPTRAAPPTLVASNPAPQPAPAPPAETHVPAAPPAANEHVVADAPFVFNAGSIAPPPTNRVMRLHVESRAITDLHPAVRGPAGKPAKAKKGFWGRLKDWFR